MKKAVHIPEIHTADAEDVRFSFAEGKLDLRFVDWQERPVTVRFSEVVATRWQDADDPEYSEFWDATCEILESDWVELHRKQGMLDGETRHLRLHFNAGGVFDVLCGNYVVE